MLESFVIYALALWRVTSLFTNEDGPFYIFFDLRGKIQWLDERFDFLHRFRLLEGYTCEWCFSLWIGSLLAIIWYFLGDVFIYVLVIPAGSTVVIVIKYIVQGLEKWNKKLEE